jgi:hypothetical protein
VFSSKRPFGTRSDRGVTNYRLKIGIQAGKKCLYCAIKIVKFSLGLCRQTVFFIYDKLGRLEKVPAILEKKDGFKREN